MSQGSQPDHLGECYPDDYLWPVALAGAPQDHGEDREHHEEQDNEPHVEPHAVAGADVGAVRLVVVVAAVADLLAVATLQLPPRGGDG